MNQKFCLKQEVAHRERTTPTHRQNDTVKPNSKGTTMTLQGVVAMTIPPVRIDPIRVIGGNIDLACHGPGTLGLLLLTLDKHNANESDDNGGGGSSDNSDTNSLWKSYSSSSSSSTSSQSRRLRTRPEDDVIIPYETIPPTIKSELKPEDLPSWDGDHKMAIAYFWKVQERATLGGYIPQALGYWLWLKLKEGLDVQGWFSILLSHEQAKMHGHWVDYLRGIKEGYLGRQWQFDIGEEYKSQYFCQPGHENELPKTVIACRIMYTRMLAKLDNRGPLEVHLVMARAPLAWRMVLVLGHIKSTSTLYTKALEHQESLLTILRTKPSMTIMTENLVTTL